MNLEELSLNKNKIGAEGIKALERDLSVTCLRLLSLEENGIDDVAVESLVKNTSLTHLITSSELKVQKG